MVTLTWVIVVRLTDMTVKLIMSGRMMVGGKMVIGGKKRLLLVTLMGKFLFEICY